MSDGYAGIWLMSGSAISSAVGLWGPVTGARIGAVGDFDGDGMSDLMWTDDATQVEMDFMNGTSVTHWVANSPPSSTCTLQQARDFTGDGKPDVYWREVDGSYVTWVINGTNFPVATTVLPGGTGWEVAP